MRKLLFFASLSVVRTDGIMHKQYKRYLERGMVKMKALIALSRKLLCLIFVLARDQNEYRGDYGEKQKLKIAA